MGITSELVSTMTPLPPLLSNTQWFRRLEGIMNRYGMLCAIIRHGSLQQRQQVLELMAQEGEFDESDRALVMGVFDFSVRLQHSGFKSTHVPVHAPLPFTFIAHLFPVEYDPLQLAAAASQLVPSTVSDYSVTAFKRDLMARDVSLCVFCWRGAVHTMNGSHILAGKLIGMPGISQDSLRALLDSHGLAHVNDVRNGILLCQSCHTLFDHLEVYVERVGPDLVIKPACPPRASVPDAFLDIFRNRLTMLQDNDPLPEHFRQPDSIMRLLWPRPTLNTLPEDSTFKAHQFSVTVRVMSAASEPVDIEVASDEEEEDDEGHEAVLEEGQIQSSSGSGSSAAQPAHNSTTLFEEKERHLG
jgi:hypothetical protein